MSANAHHFSNTAAGRQARAEWERNQATQDMYRAAFSGWAGVKWGIVAEPVTGKRKREKRGGVMITRKRPTPATMKRRSTMGTFAGLAALAAAALGIGRRRAK